MNNNKSSEGLYDSLTKAFTSTIRIIKYIAYPASAIITIILIFGLWWGIDIKNSKNEIDVTKVYVENIKSSLALKEREINVSTKEIETRAQERFDSLANNFKTFESEFEDMRGDFQTLIQRYEKVLTENDILFKDLQADNKSLQEFSNEIKYTISQYTEEIDYARKGIEERMISN